MSQSDSSRETVGDIIREQAGEPRAEPASAITLSIDAVRGEVSKFDQIEAGLAELERAHPKDVVFDVTTTTGMESAIASRRAWREPRIAVEKARKAAKAPVLELGKTIDRFAGGLEVRLREGEDHYDGQIKAEEERKETVRQERLRQEAERIAGIRRRIVEAFSPPQPKADGLRRSGAELRTIYLAKGAEPIDADRFGDLVLEAEEAKKAALDWLTVAIDEAEAREAEQADLARQREELAEQRRKDAAADAERKAAEARQREQEEAERARLVRAEDDARAARAAELAQEEARIAAQRAELDRREAEVAAANLARQEAEDAAARKRHQEQVEEQDRIDAERAREQTAAAEAEKRLQAAAPAMLDLLVEWQDLTRKGEQPSGPYAVICRSRDRILANLAAAAA